MMLYCDEVTYNRQPIEIFNSNFEIYEVYDQMRADKFWRKDKINFVEGSAKSGKESNTEANYYYHLLPLLPCAFTLSHIIEMGCVNVTSIQILDNPAPFLNPLQFEITYECIQDLQDGINNK